MCIKLIVYYFYLYNLFWRSPLNAKHLAIPCFVDLWEVIKVAADKGICSQEDAFATELHGKEGKSEPEALATVGKKMHLPMNYTGKKESRHFHREDAKDAKENKHGPPHTRGWPRRE